MPLRINIEEEYESAMVQARAPSFMARQEALLQKARSYQEFSLIPVPVRSSLNRRLWEIAIRGFNTNMAKYFVGCAALAQYQNSNLRDEGISEMYLDIAEKLADRMSI